MTESMRKSPMYGVYRMLKSGALRYVSRSATHSQRLAEDIAESLTRGEVVMPTGAIAKVRPFPHIAKQID